MSRKLTEHHPIMINVNKLYDIMTEMGISIDYNYMGGLDIIDTKTNKRYKLKDNDGGEYVPNFPCLTEFKLVIED